VQGNLTPFLCSLADLGSRLSLPPLRDAARDLLRLLPAEQSVISALRARLFTEGGGDGADLERFFQVTLPCCGSGSVGFICLMFLGLLDPDPLVR
jgi:hypothetical protein